MKNKQESFCIISHNCWGAEIYKKLNIPYNTPFIGLFIPSTCFIKLLNNPTFYLSQPISFTKKSTFEIYNTPNYLAHYKYPIGLLNNEIEIHFMHYKSEQEAKEKWTRRVNRMPLNQNLWFIAFSNREILNKEEIKLFDNLPFKNKVFFSHEKIKRNQSLIYIKELKNELEIFDGKALYELSTKYFHVSKWVKGHNPYLSIFEKLLLETRIILIRISKFIKPK